MDLATRDKTLIDFEKRGIDNDGHLFIVKNLAQHESKQQWVPVPGAVMPQFISGGHEFQYFCPNRKDVAEPLLRELALVNSGEKELYELDRPSMPPAIKAANDESAAVLRQVMEEAKQERAEKQALFAKMEEMQAQLAELQKKSAPPSADQPQEEQKSNKKPGGKKK